MQAANLYALGQGTASSGVSTAATGLQSAQATYTNNVTPTLPCFMGFQLTASNPTIAHGSAGTSTITATFDSDYSGTITWSAIGLDSNALTYTFGFSPTTNSASGTTTLTITVPSSGSGAVTGAHLVQVTGTDAAGLTNTVTVTVTVT
jgi:hypothetical protein